MPTGAGLVESIHCPQAGGVRARVGITAGVLEWTCETTEQSRGDEAVLLGVSEPVLGSHTYSDASCRAVLLQAFNGSLYVLGQGRGAPSGVVRSFHPGDRVNFTLDMNDGSAPGRLSVCIGASGDVLTLCEDVPVGMWHPAFVAYGSGGRATLLQIRRRVPRNGPSSSGPLVRVGSVRVTLQSRLVAATFTGPQRLRALCERFPRTLHNARLVTADWRPVDAASGERLRPTSIGWIGADPAAAAAGEVGKNGSHKEPPRTSSTGKPRVVRADWLA
jgi:hypothetical protein